MASSVAASTTLFALALALVLCFAKGGAAGGTEELVIGEVAGAVTLTCWNTSQQIVKVEWFHGDPGATPILLSSEGGLPYDARFSLVGNSSLHITDLRLQDEGNYTCKEVLNGTDHRHRVRLLMASGPNKVTVKISSTTLLPNGTLYAGRHAHLNFTCTSDSWPIPTTQWQFYPSGSIHEPFTDVNSSVSYFVMYNISPGYQGNYSCSSINPLSHHQETVTQELLIYYPPPLLPKCWAQTSTEDSGGVQLYCTWPGGYPHPTLQWAQKGNLSWVVNTTSFTDTIMATLDSSRLVDGEEFICHGSHVITQEAKQGCSVQLEAPSIMTDPIRTCFVGGNVIMTCQSTASNPPAHLAWLRNLSLPETEILSGGRFLVHQDGNTSTLLIRNCSHGTDDGYYICKANNSVGLKEIYIYLTVTEPVNTAGIVAVIVVVLLLGVLILSGLLLYFGPYLCVKENMLRNQDASDILILMDSEEEEELADAGGDTVSGMLGKGCTTHFVERLTCAENALEGGSDGTREALDYKIECSQIDSSVTGETSMTMETSVRSGGLPSTGHRGASVVDSSPVSDTGSCGQ